MDNQISVDKCLIPPSHHTVNKLAKSVCDGHKEAEAKGMQCTQPDDQ